MRKKYFSHWPFLITGPVLSFILILFWYFNQNYLSQAKGPVDLLLENPILTFGAIIFGAFLSAFISGEFGIKTPRTYEPLVYAFIGGCIMGCGAVTASMSVHSTVLFNLAGIFNLTAFMITKGWIYAVCMVGGGYAGSKLFLYLILKTRRLKKDFFIPKAFTVERNQRILFFASLVLFLLFMLAVVLFSVLTAQEKAGFFLAAMLLVLFGMTVERGTICMSSMLKEWFLAHSAYVWRSVLFVIMCLALLYQAGLKFALYQPIQLEPYIQNMHLLIIGSFLMGFGFIFADGCFIGSLWKAGQGNIINFAGILGMLMGMGVSQPLINSFKHEASYGMKFPAYFDSMVSPLIFLILLWALGVLLLIVSKQKHYKY
jgi:uncharacterized membrane protein YedE/YeeE